MARKRDRAFALTMALLFFITAFGFSFLVIWQLTHNSQSGASPSSTQTPSTTPKSCSETSVSGTASAAPAVYKVQGEVKSLQVKDLVAGSGQAAKDGSCLTVKYYGTLAQSGKEFDENFDQPTALEFQLGEGQVIKGWDMGLLGMKVGGTRRLVIPASLAYGSESPSSAIPPNSDLVFVVKLLSIQ